MKLIITILIVAEVFVGSVGVMDCHADTWDAYADFSVTNGNPNGAWSYGTAPNVNTGYAFSSFTVAGTSPVAGVDSFPAAFAGLDYWFNSWLIPFVARNPTGVNMYDSGWGTYPANCLIMHPTTAPPMAATTSVVVRWTSPGNAPIIIDGGFFSIPYSGCDVHVMKNGVALWEDVLTGNSKSFSLNTSVSTNDTIDFVLGANGFQDGDLSGLNATITGTLVMGMAISDVKNLSDGSSVALSPKVVTYSSPGIFYIEEDSRRCGIRVHTTGYGLPPGNRVVVNGEVWTNADGERYIAASTVQANGGGGIAPLGFSNKALGGGDWHYDPATSIGQRGVDGGVGLNNIGCLVRTTGLVTYSVPGSDVAYIDDGSGLYDGNALGSGGSTVSGVRLMLFDGVSMPPTGAYVAVTGVSSMVTLVGKIVHAILVQKQTDIQWLGGSSGVYDGVMLVVDSGVFRMGNSGVGNDLTWGNADELPQHSVSLAGFAISQTEVTRAQFSAFIAAGGYADSAYWSSDGWKWRLANNRIHPEYWNAPQNWGTPPGLFAQADNCPVTGVSYYEAEAFCNWAGGHLPTEAQWEKAARWNSSISHASIYPWGDTWDSARSNGWDDTLYPGNQTAPVGSYPLGDSPCGCRDMAGNVSEWVQDWYRSYEGSSSPFDYTNIYRVVRGSGWADSGISQARCAARNFDSPACSWSSVGFRVVR